MVKIFKSESFKIIAVLSAIMFVFFACNSKVSSSVITNEKIIDTSISIINPLKRLEAKGFLFDTLIIDEPTFRIVTTYDRRKAQVKTSFEPKKELIVKVKMKQTTTTEQTSYKQSTKERRKDILIYWLIIVICLIMLVGSIMFMIKKFHKYIEHCSLCVYYDVTVSNFPCKSCKHYNSNNIKSYFKLKE